MTAADATREEYSMEDPYNTGAEKGSSVLGPTLEFKGELKADEDLLIRGKVEGSIRHSSNLKIGKEGRIEAEVRAEYIEVHGEVKGDLTGSKSVVVRSSANVTGNIYSPNVSLHEGATFNGTIDMSVTGKSAKKEVPPAEKAAPEPKASKETDKVVDETPAANDAADEASDEDGKQAKSASKRKTA